MACLTRCSRSLLPIFSISSKSLASLAPCQTKCHIYLRTFSRWSLLHEEAHRKYLHRTAISESSRESPSNASQTVVPSTVICLLNTDGKLVAEMTYEEAKKMAVKKNLILTRLMDKNQQKSLVYQLMTAEQCEDQKVKMKEMKKELKKSKGKTLGMTSKIDRHDLEMKVKHALQWLEHDLHVHVNIHNKSPGNNQGVLQIIKTFNEMLNDKGIIANAIVSRTHLKFELQPPSALDEEHKTKKSVKLFTVNELIKQIRSNQKPAVN